MADSWIRVIILEDHPMMRETLEARLVTHSDDMLVLYAGPSIEDAQVLAARSDVHCVILDLDLGDGTSFTENLEQVLSIGAPILIVSANASPSAVQLAMSRGVKGYVSKQSPPEEFIRAFDAVLTDQVYVSTDLAAMMSAEAGGRVSLSAQEQRALMLYSSGMKLDAVARRMGVSSATAKEYIRRVRMKYAAAGNPAPTKIELYRKAHEEGLL